MDKLTEIKGLRREYGSGKIDYEQVFDDPFDLFETWWDRALQQLKHIEINACTLATTDHEGQPNARTVLLKDFDRHGFCFFTNYLSKKGQEIEHNPKVCILFYWKELEQQIKLKGVLSKLDRAKNISYFSSRPKDSQIGSLISNQSQPLVSQTFLEEKFLETQKYYQDKEIVCPEHWGGYRLEPNYYEFWQGQANRLHHRVAYQKIEGTIEKWTKTLLFP